MAQLKSTVVLGNLTVTGKIIGDVQSSGGTGMGSVTSVGLSVPTGLTVSNSPITTSGVLAVSLASGYSIPLANDVTKGVTAHGWGNHADQGYSKFSGSYSDLTGAPTIPTKTSELTNDSNFITSTELSNLTGFLKLDGSTEMTGPIKFADRGNSTGKGNNYISAGGGHNKTSGLCGLKILALEQANAHMGMGVDLCNSGYELVVSTGRADDSTASKLTFATNSAVRNGVAVTADTVVYKELGGFTASGKETPDVTFNVKGTITGANLGSSSSVFDSAHIKEINLHKHSGGGKISFYGDSGYTTWYEYMNNTGTADVPGGGTSLAYGEVTGWSRRSLLESSSSLRYGWVWESRPSPNSTASPTPLMSLGASYGNLRVRGSITFGEKATWQYNSSTDCVELAWL